MAIRLQIEEGKIKEYRTAYGVYGGEDGPEKYATNCEREWKEKPRPQEECDHLDCAIYAAEYTSNYQKERFWIFLSICIFWLLLPFLLDIYRFAEYDIPLDFEWGLIPLILLTPMCGLPALFAIYHIWQSDKSAKKAKELLEFRDHRTINGVKASQIFDDQEEAKAKHWWKFWR